MASRGIPASKNAAAIRKGGREAWELAANLSDREATIALFRGLPEAALLRSGVADGKRSTVRALGYHIAGHEAHHVRILQQRYLGREHSQPS